MRAKRQQRRSVFECEQPFDLFEEFDRGLMPHQAAKKKPNRFVYMVLFGLSFLAFVVVAMGLMKRFSPSEKESVYALLELRAVDSEGSSVAGAEVFLRKKKLGVTDSFGEWRRYLRLTPGEKVHAGIVKKSMKGTIYWQAEISLPKSYEGKGQRKESEWRMTVELKPKRSSVAATNRVKRSSARKRKPNHYPEDEVLLSDRIIDTGSLNAVNIRMSAFKPSLNSLMESHQYQVLKEKIVPEMVAQAAEKGLEITRSPDWTIELEYVPYRGHVGLIKGHVKWSVGKRYEKRSFLLPFAKTIMKTAEQVLKRAAKHVNRGYHIQKARQGWVLGTGDIHEFWRPKQGLKLINMAKRVFTAKQASENLMVVRGGNPCSSSEKECMLVTASSKEMPPRGSWSLQRLSISGSLPRQAELFVDGYQAFPNGSDFDFWGATGKPHKLIIIHRGEVFHRASIVPRRGAPTVIRLRQVLASGTNRTSTRAAN